MASRLFFGHPPADTTIGQGGDPAPLPHLGLLLGPTTVSSGSGAPSLPLLTASGAGTIVH
ncbi:hypothetical protein LDC_0764, partial [sediment metagenome]